MSINNFQEFSKQCGQVENRWVKIYNEILRIRTAYPKFAFHSLKDDRLRALFYGSDIHDVAGDLTRSITNINDDFQVAEVKIKRANNYLAFLEKNLSDVESQASAASIPPSTNDLDDLLSRDFDY